MSKEQKEGQCGQNRAERAGKWWDMKPGTSSGPDHMGPWRLWWGDCGGETAFYSKHGSESVEV